jgi:hypothetical protein
VERMSRKHHVRSRVFRTCGVALIASVLLAATPGSSAQPRHEGEAQLPLRAASQATHPLHRIGSLPDLVAQRTLKRIYAP